MLLPTIIIPSLSPQSLIINYPTHFSLTSINITQFRLPKKKNKTIRFENQKTVSKSKKSISKNDKKSVLTPRLHAKVTVKLKRLPRYCFGQKIDMLERGWYEDDRNLFSANQHSVCPIWPGV